MKIKFNTKKCVGCKTCELVCSNKNNSIYNTSLSNIRIITNINTMMFKANYCRQCKEANCIQACPVSALMRNDDDIVVINKAICILCGKCVDACQFNAIHISENILLKCELCEGEPMCVIHCPTNALTVD